MVEQYLKITFRENCDVHYYLEIRNYNLEKFSLVVDYPSNKIELLDDDSIYPIYISDLPNQKTLITIKEHNRNIIVKYIKKNFLKKITIDDNKTHYRYKENIEISLLENSKGFTLSIHSPYSYISALRNKSFTKFNGVSYSPGQVSRITLQESGIMEVDWELEIIESKKLNNKEEVELNSKETNRISFNFNDKTTYNWLDKLNQDFFKNNLSYLTKRLLHSDIKEILKGSCFYLSAGADITPIIALQDKIRSFLFCDLHCYDSIRDLKNKFNGILIKLKDRLIAQGFDELLYLKVDGNFLGIEDTHYSNGENSKLENAELSIWEKNNSLFSLLYINWENSETFYSLYVKNKIIPKAFCEISPEGGSIGLYSKIKIPYKFRMPEYYIGHKYSLGKPEEYEIIYDRIKYFGDYPNSYGNAGSDNGLYLYKRKNYPSD